MRRNRAQLRAIFAEMRHRGAVHSPQMGRATETVGSASGYVYHATNTERAMEIARSGLKLHRPSQYTDQLAWPDGSRRRRAYFSDSAHTVWAFAPEEGQSTVLRAKKAAHPFRRESTGDIYTEHPIAPHALEVLTAEGRWVPLRRFEAKQRRWERLS